MTHLERELDKLKRKILALGALVENNLRFAFQAIEQRDRDKARKVIVGDFEIDQQEVEVEEECLKLLALYQPVAGDLRFDLLSKVATRGAKRIELSQREWTLLELFLRHPGQVLSRAQILSAVWDYSFDPGSNVVDVYVGYLRKKLDRPGEDSMIQTVRGAGYRFSAS